MSAGGVRFLDHTADVGMDLRAASLPELLRVAARGMLALLRGHDDAPSAPAPAPATAADPDPIRIELAAGDAMGLLAGWLRELLFLHEVGGRDFVAADFDHIDERSLTATIRTEPAVGAVREIKGVTYHELDAQRLPGGDWRARVIFDV